MRHEQENESQQPHEKGWSRRSIAMQCIVAFLIATFVMAIAIGEIGVMSWIGMKPIVDGAEKDRVAFEERGRKSREMYISNEKELLQLASLGEKYYTEKRLVEAESTLLRD